LTRDELNDDEFFALSDGVLNTNDTHCTILMTSFLERQLERCVISQLTVVDDDVIESLTGREGALATFYSKIHLAYAMGLFDPVARTDLGKR
jgi:hypothetical protein